jgi:hypothetical protein
MPDEQLKHIELNDPQIDVIETTAQRVLMHCGVGVGKSHCIGLISSDFIINDPEIRGFIGANTYGQLSKSTLDRVFKVWEDIFGMRRDVHYVVDRIPPDGWPKFGPQLKSYENTICFNNGCLVFIGSLDNYKVIDGIEFGWACLDETKDTKEEAVKEVIIARLRQIGLYLNDKGTIIRLKTAQERLKNGEYTQQLTQDGDTFYDSQGKKLSGYNPLFIFTSPAKVKWLSDWFKLDESYEDIVKTIFTPNEYYRKRTGDQLVVIASTHHNAKNLSPGYISRMCTDLGNNEGLIHMLIYGSPFGKSGGEFYSAYSRGTHVKEFEIDENLPLHISFDFNVVPYITATLWQVVFDNETGRYKARAFDELCLESPHNNAESLAQRAVGLYSHLMKNGLYYYGDYSGKNGNTMTAEFKHHYEVIEKQFADYLTNYSDRVIVNPLLVKRRNFINKMYSGGFNVDIEIHTRCKNLIADCEFVKEGPDGGKLKKVVKNKTTGKSYQEHGHTSDSKDYFLCSCFNNLFNE